MMWNWLASGLASGATLVLYDGSPFYPDGNVLWDYAQANRCQPVLVLRPSTWRHEQGRAGAEAAP
ncbi:MAG: hypothetical protein R3E95_00290 [Thiolinea sp.]